MSTELDPKDLFDIPDPYATPLGLQGRDEAPRATALPKSATRKRVRWQRFGAVTAAILCEAMFVGVMGVRESTELSARIVVYGVALPVVAAAAVIGLAGASKAKGPWIATAIAAGFMLFFATALVTEGAGDASDAGIVRCIFGGSMMVAVPVALGLFATRHAFTQNTTGRAAALGVAAGLLGTAALRVNCPNDALLHLLLGHAPPLLLVVLVASIVGKRLLRA